MDDVVSPPTTTEPVLPLARYRLHFRALDTFPLEEDPRGLWHGVFGRALRAACCVTRQPQCDGCLLLHQCQYSYLFTAPRPPDADLMRLYPQVPVPHVLQVQPLREPQVRAGGELTLSVVLVGEANARLPLVVEALAAAGADGLGRARGRVVLQQVDQELPGREPVTIGSHGRLGEWAAPAVPLTPPRPARVRLEILSPYKASGKGASPHGLDLGLLLMAIVRRVSLLQYFYTGRQLQADFSALKAASLVARASDHDLQRAASARWAARHGRRVDTGGLAGHLDMETDPIAPLWPYLHLGQWLNVGKNASMGFGQYRLIPDP